MGGNRYCRVYVVNNNEDLWQKQKNLMRTAAL